MRWRRALLDTRDPGGEARKDAVPRADSSLEKLASLKTRIRPCERAGHITRGNASPLTDGAARSGSSNEAGLGAGAEGPPRASAVDWEIAAVDIFHEGLLMAPAIAIPRSSPHTTHARRIDLWEIPRAFAAQVLCNVAALESEAFFARSENRSAWQVSMERFKPEAARGALGHPFGATGARILSKREGARRDGPGKRAGGLDLAEAASAPWPSWKARDGGPFAFPVTGSGPPAPRPHPALFVAHAQRVKARSCSEETGLRLRGPSRELRHHDQMTPEFLT
jgi:hypothetical protein